MNSLPVTARVHQFPFSFNFSRRKAESQEKAQQSFFEQTSLPNKDDGQRHHSTTDNINFHMTDRKCATVAKVHWLSMRYKVAVKLLDLYP